MIQKWLPLAGRCQRLQVRDLLPTPAVLVPQHILIVEQDNELVEGLAMFFKMKGYSVSFASNGSEGLSSAKEDPPDLILSALSTNHLDGVSLLETLQGDPETRSIPFLLMSSRTDTWIEQEVRERGADGFFRKPFEINQLANQVNELLREKKSCH